mmetsp:Transcript_22493/g.39861  ORF Transcript_22493/g.39861 Transcript_22493/m.39861 type:complete len:249 (-) Transcript_22493:75-821(-)
MLSISLVKGCAALYKLEPTHTSDKENVKNVNCVKDYWVGSFATRHAWSSAQVMMMLLATARSRIMSEWLVSTADSEALRESQSLHVPSLDADTTSGDCGTKCTFTTVSSCLHICLQACVLRSKILRVPSVPPVARKGMTSQKATVSTELSSTWALFWSLSWSWLKLAITRLVSMLAMRAVPSCPPATRIGVNEEHARLTTPAWCHSCPVKLCTQVEVFGSHIRTEPSREPVMARLPLGENWPQVSAAS